MRHVFASTDQVAAELVRMTIDAASAAIAARGKFTMALTGGSAATSLYPVLAQAALPWERVHVFFGDERCVPPAHADSNYGLAEKAFLSKIDIPQRNVHRMRGEIDPEDAAAEYGQMMNQICGPDLALDVVHLGMGPDGHICSLFPGHPLLDSNRFVASLSDSPKPPPSRVTLCYPALENARALWFLVLGANKAEAVRDVLLDPACSLPAARAVRANKNVVWLLDESAARLLKTG